MNIKGLILDTNFVMQFIKAYGIPYNAKNGGFAPNGVEPTLIEKVGDHSYDMHTKDGGYYFFTLAEKFATAIESSEKQLRVKLFKSS